MSITQNNSTVYLDEAATVNDTIGASLLEDLFDGEEIETLVIAENDDKTISQSLGSSAVKQQTERFSYQSDLGEGAYGKVWKADDGDIGRSVAVKSYKYSGQAGHRLLTLETKIAGKIDHPNVPALYDVKKSEDDQYHVIMKYVQGETLESIIEKLRAGDPETLAKYRFEQRSELMVQILRALSAAHAKGIIHRDIKAENIMVGSSGEAYLMDWGIALDLKESNGAGQLAGTPRYMSPEQATQQALDIRSDLFSITAVLMEFITLREHGPKAESVEALLKKVPEHNITNATFMSSSVTPFPFSYIPIFLKGLSLDPKDRYQSAEEMIAELEGAVCGDVCVECPVTLALKIATVVRKGIMMRPMITVPLLLFSFVGIIGLSVYIGTLIAA